MRKIQAVTYTRTIVQTTGKHVTPAQNGRVGIRRYRSIAMAHGVQGKETFLCLQTYDAAHGCANLSGKRLQGSGRTGPCAESSYSRHSSGPFGHGPLGWNENGFRASPSPTRCPHRWACSGREANCCCVLSVAAAAGQHPRPAQRQGWAGTMDSQGRVWRRMNIPDASPQRPLVADKLVMMR